MIDLDSLKFVNDRYRHLFGDKVLKEFGIILIDSIQKNDIACRFSGDEFVVLIRDVDIDRLS
ncbi:MAG: diguanylate cyclase [Firmicutes bacterium]|nr:diguanylate cyclase [Bacillota bacterium]